VSDSNESKKSRYVVPAILTLGLVGGVATTQTTNAAADVVQVCHKPGTPAAKVLTIPESALPGHLGHGDFLMGGKGGGSCN